MGNGKGFGRVGVGFGLFGRGLVEPAKASVLLLRDWKALFASDRKPLGRFRRPTQDEVRCNLHSLVTTSDQCESLEEKKVTNEIMVQLYKIKKEIMVQLDRRIKL